MTTYSTSNMNLQNDCVSPITPAPSSSSSSSENPFFKKYFRSSLSSDYSSPYLSRPIINYYHGNITGSGGSTGGGSNRTPLSPLVKVEEDVLVMDCVLVGSKSSSKGGGNSSSSSLSSSSGGSLYKTELCKSWEDSGYCRYGCKCQFAHGQEELRSFPSRLRNMKKLEMNKPKSSPLSSSVSPRNVFAQDNTTTPGTSSSTSKLTKPSPLLSNNWSPMDDGITVSLPGSIDEPPTRARVDEHIDNVLCGPTTRKRLSVFRDICPE